MTDMKSTADIVIIGAGVHGVGLAVHLAKAGAGSIVVLEKKHVAAGPTAKSGAGVTGNPTAYWIRCGRMENLVAAI